MPWAMLRSASSVLWMSPVRPVERSAGPLRVGVEQRPTATSFSASEASFARTLPNGFFQPLSLGGGRRDSAGASANRVRLDRQLG